jgi:hypothetical protein
MFFSNKMESWLESGRIFLFTPKKAVCPVGCVPFPFSERLQGGGCVEKSHLKHPLALLKLAQMTRGAASQQAFRPQIYGAFFEQQIMTSLSGGERCWRKQPRRFVAGESLR